MAVSAIAVSAFALTSKTYLSGRLFGAFIIYAVPAVSRKVKVFSKNRKKATCEVS